MEKRMADRNSSVFDSLFEEPYVPQLPLSGFDEQDFELRTLEDDDAFMRLLTATEESARMASASESRSRKSLVVGVLTLLVATATLLVALFGSPFTTTSGTSTEMPAAEASSDAMSR